MGQRVQKPHAVDVAESRDAGTMSGGACAPAGAAQWAADGLIAADWILATAVIAGVTRAVRRD
jgi:hypothetical protein